jgi:hypothetical protein
MNKMFEYQYDWQWQRDACGRVWIEYVDAEGLPAWSMIHWESIQPEYLDTTCCIVIPAWFGGQK